MNNILYPPITPFNKGFLEVSNIHKVYYEQCGNKNGIPILFLHGGPGGGFLTRDRRYFNPEHYHIILFDQRGAGKSLPLFSLIENESKYLLEDIEKLRKYLSITKWAIFGGSWGSTLALLYCETFIENVLGLIVHGISLATKEESVWFYQRGACFLFPEEYDEFIDVIPKNERSDILRAYHSRLTSKDYKENLKYALAWTKWEMSTFSFEYKKESIDKALNPKNALALAQIECHYFINDCFLKKNQLIKNAFILKNSRIPIYIIHGRYDSVCPLNSAWELYKEIPDSNFCIVEASGHAPREPLIQTKLVHACDSLITDIKNKLNV
ncbi:proline iminopeptidase [Neoconidiobolus thromboides FSU 785]|nr:proline iminopeptidase [Neoconidiobolus thromboides FSU 785]